MKRMINLKVILSCMILLLSCGKKQFEDSKNMRTSNPGGSVSSSNASKAAPMPDTSSVPSKTPASDKEVLSGATSDTSKNEDSSKTDDTPESKFLVDTEVQKKPVIIDTLKATNVVDSEGGAIKKRFADVLPVPSGLDVGIQFSAGKTTKDDDTKGLRPLAIYFALDVTGSMAVNIQGIKNGIGGFVAKLTEKKFEVKLGLVPFRDSIETILPLTSNLDSFKSAVNAQIATGGGDSNEIALAATKTALENLQKEASADSIKVIITITDHPGHNADKLPRDCSISSLVSSFNALPEDQQKLTRIFYSIDSLTDSPCSGYQTGVKQWSDLISKALPSVDPAMRGGSLPYPFNGDVLANDFVAMLEKVIPGNDRICLLSKAEVLLDGKSMSTWKPESPAIAYDYFLKSKPFLWTDGINAKDLDAFEKGSSQINATTCCYLKSAVEAGTFGECKELTENIEFKIVVKK
ncbi:MAG: VWA domain-containing protein [Oligoflexales bacterium]|nr:VWA domain-containing protein [Oligoflexales bacterium]